MDYIRSAQNIVDVLAKFGGLLALILKGFGAVGFFLNSKFLMGKIIRTLYLVKNCDHSH